MSSLLSLSGMDLSDPGETKPDDQLWQGTSLGATSWSGGSEWPEVLSRVGNEALAWVCQMVEEGMIQPARGSWEPKDAEHTRSLQLCLGSG